jgi:hypothetical protein
MRQVGWGKGLQNGVYDQRVAVKMSGNSDAGRKGSHRKDAFFQYGEKRARTQSMWLRMWCEEMYFLVT